MNKFLRYSFAMLLACVGFTAQAQEQVIWQEDWSAYDATVDPATVNPGVYFFEGTVYNEDGSIKSGTKFYDANLAGGEAPELLIAKNGGSFAVNIVFEGDAPSEMTLSWKANKALTVEILDGGTVGEISNSGNDYSCPVTFVANENNSMTIKFKMAGSANARFDNAKLATGQGKKPAGLSYGTSSRTVTIGADDNVFPELQNNNNLPVTYSSSVTDVATINADGVITLVAPGKTVIKAEFAGNDEYEAGYAQYELTVKEGADPNAKGGVNNPYTVSEALEVINALENGATTSDKFYVKGYVVGTPDIQKKDDGTFYGNANFYIADEANGTTTLYCYRLKGLENANIESEDYIKEGDKLVVVGQFQKYVKDEVVTPEVKNGNIVSIEGGGTPDPGIPTVESQPVLKFTANGQWASYTFNKADFKAAVVTGFRIEYADMTGVDQNGGTSAALFNILVNSAETHLGKDWAGNDAQVPNKTSYKNAGFTPENTVFEGDFAEFVATDDPDTTCPTIGQFALQSCASGNSVVIKKVVFILSDGSEILPEYKGDDWGGGAYTIEDVTGISNINATPNTNGAIYNLAGQRVDENYRGIVIKNGKKVMQ